MPAALAPLAGDPRLVAAPWDDGALDAVRDGETVAIVGTGHTAIDLIGTRAPRGRAAA